MTIGAYKAQGTYSWRGA